MKKSRILSLALAGAVTAAALFAGTYAWRSFTQDVTNEVQGSLNPGGRLHDDFNGMNINASDKKIKKVYVENFTTDGAPIYARIKFEEYLEIGEGAGKVDDTGHADATNKATSIISGATIDGTNWETYKWDEENSKFRDYVDLNLGGYAYYLKTYNMDKDSLEPDANGTLEGKSGTAYDDYDKYNAGESRWGVEIHALDDLGLDEVNTAGLTTQDIIDAVVQIDTSTGTPGTMTVNTTNVNEDTNTVTIKGTPYPMTKVEKDAGGTNITAISVDLSGNDGIAEIMIKIPTTAHTVEKSLETDAAAPIVLMEDWIDNGCQSGNFWVCDTDGWAYWARPILSQTATGCLLNSISLVNGAPIDGEFYYGLNAVAQFATAGDWGSEEATAGFRANDITEEALDLLNRICGENEYNEVTITGDTKLSPEDTSTYTATVTAHNGTTSENVSLNSGDIEWTVSGNTDPSTSIDPATGELTIGENETTGGTLIVKAVYKDDETHAKTIKVSVDNYVTLKGKTIAVGSLETVTYDGIEFYVAYKDTANQQALLWSKEVISNQKMEFGSDNRWDGSSVQSYLKGDFLTNHTEIAGAAKQATIYTRDAFDSTTYTMETQDYVFLLSEEDVFDKSNGEAVTGDASKAYTAGAALDISKQTAFTRNLTDSNYNWSWLRSPRSGANSVAAVFYDGRAGNYRCPNINGIRPAFWVEY